SRAVEMVGLCVRHVASHEHELHGKVLLRLHALDVDDRQTIGSHAHDDDAWGARVFTGLTRAWNRLRSYDLFGPDLVGACRHGCQYERSNDYRPKSHHLYLPSYVLVKPTIRWNRWPLLPFAMPANCT